MIEATRTRRYAFDAGSTFNETVAITATDQADNLAGLPFQVIRDTTPPTISLTVPSSGTLRFGVRWTGVDPEAGIRRFELEYRTESGSWTRLRPGLLHRPGERYYFRLQATDRVSNTVQTEAGPVDAASGVTKYYPFHGQRVAMRRGDEVRMRICMETTWARPP